MNKAMINLEGKLLDIMQSAEKARAVLGDLAEDYSFANDEPTQREVEKIAWESARIMQFIGIALDYAHGIGKDISQATDDFNIIWNMFKEANAAPTGKKRICIEQINAILDNMNEVELKQVHEFVLSASK